MINQEDRSTGLDYFSVHGNAVRSGIGTKIVVERAMFLHDDDDMFDLVNPARSASAWDRTRGRADIEECCYENAHCSHRCEAMM